MKQVLLAIIIMFTLTSCRITKSLEMIQAKTNAKKPEKEFLDGKFDAVNFLQLDVSQKEKCNVIWKTEKEALIRINTKDNASIAPVIFQSETDFRKVLTDEQIIKYKKLSKTYDSRLSDYFLDDHALSEIKRIYKL